MKKYLSRLAPICILTAAVPFSASPQTQINLGNQTSDVNFSQAAFTRPIKVGTSLPSTCTTGDLFFNSASSAGTNLFGCAPANSWSQFGNNSGSSTSPGVSFAYDNGTANVYAVSLPSVTTYTDGLQILILPANSNTAASTLAVSSLPPVAIKTLQGLDTITPGAIRFGSPADLVYSASDGYFILTNPAVVTQQTIAPATGFLIDFTQYPPLVSPDPTYICLQTQTCSPTGGQNLSGAAFLTLPKASTDPSVCSIGQIYFNTTSAATRSCTATNTWSGSGGTGGAGSGTFCNLTGVASGAATCPGSPAPTSLTGLIMSVQVDAANTGAVTVNVAGLGVAPLLTAGGGALAANALTTGITYLAAYAGNAFHLASSGGPIALQTLWDFCTAAPCNTSVDIITQPYPITVPTWNPVYGLISAGTAPTGSSLVIAVYKNGSVAQTFTLPAGSTSAVLAPTFTSVQGDVLTASVTQVGSTIAGARVTIVLTASVTGTTGAAGTAGASGPVSFVTNARSGTYQTLSSDFASCKSIPVASGTFTITLVAGGSQPASGQCVFVINYGSGVVTVATSGQNINGSSSSLTLAAGSPSAPTGVLVVSDGTNYEGQLFGTAGTGTLTARTYNLLIGGINGAGSGLYPTATLGAGSLLSNAGGMPGGFTGLPYIGYVSAGSVNAYWAWAIDQNWDSTKPVNLILGSVDVDENGGNFKVNAAIGCFTSGGSTTPTYGSAGTTGLFSFSNTYVENTIAGISMSACAANSLAIVAVTRDSTVSGNSGDVMGLARATLTYSVK